MAKIVEEVVVIKFSKIVKDNEDANFSVAGDEVQAALEQVGNGVVVEVEKA